MDAEFSMVGNRVKQLGANFYSKGSETTYLE